MIGSPDRSKRLAWMVLLLALMAGAIESLWMATPAVVAQEEPAAEEEPADKPAPKKAQKGGDAAAAVTHSEENVVIWVLRISGAIGIFIIILSCYFIQLVSRLFIDIQSKVAMPPDLMDDLKQKMEKRDYKGVYQGIKDRDCLFSRYTSSGLAELSAGLAEARDAMERTAEVQVVEMEKKISMLAVLGSLGPMIGLLGTLKGMIASFMVIARSDAGIKANEVAEAISEALVVTFMGVALSVPAIFFFAVFKNRVAQISSQTMYAADEFIRKLAVAAKAAAKAPAAPAPAAAPAPKPA
ncbi:MAG: MotA/TolQ/ExbB proton channel family protein [Planctomycetaceae bacterium]